MMNLLTSTCGFPIRVLLIFYLMGAHLLSAAIEVQCLGYLTVEPAGVFQLGSNLTLYCHITDDRDCSRLPLSLLLDGVEVKTDKRVNCTTDRFRLTTLHNPTHVVECLIRKSGMTYSVCGLVLHGGLRPDKPTDVNCEKVRDSELLDCWWNKGKETYLSTSYSISFTSANGTQIYNVVIQRENFTMPQTLLDENENYQLTVSASNSMGESTSEPFRFCVKDVVLPETPVIVHIEFGQDRSTATVHCNSTESSKQLSYHAKLRSGNGPPWLSREGTWSGTGLIRVEGLKALTEYEFQARACYSIHAGGLAMRPTSTSRSSPTSPVISSQRPRCSKWSPSIRRVSPGKGPSLELQVWRTLGHCDNNGVQNVTVLWKPPPPEDYTGGLQHYEVVLGDPEHKASTYPPARSACVVQVSPGVRTLRVSAVTSYGRSPPAALHFRPSDVPGPALRRPLPAGHESVVLSWSGPPSGHDGPGDAGELVGYVTEWTSGPADLHWNKEPRDQNTTIIRGLKAGVRYNFSVYTVTTMGVSKPSSALAYSEELLPLLGPKVSVVGYEAGRILIQWEELPEWQQRGFITSYTVYVRTLPSGPRRESIRVRVSSPLWLKLNSSEHSVILSVSASNLAGEGPQGERLPYQVPDTHPQAGLVTAFVLTITLFSMAAVTLICCSSVRKRIKQSCISWGPSWLVENVPNPENSKANSVLECSDSRAFSETSSAIRDCDPPPAPIEEVTEGTSLLATQPGAPPAAGSWPGLAAGTGTPLPAGGPAEFVAYKPHAACAEGDGEETGQGGGGGGGGVGGEQRDAPSDTTAWEQGSGGPAMSGEPPGTWLFCGEAWGLPGQTLGTTTIDTIVGMGFNESSGGRLSSILSRGMFFGGCETEDQGTMCAVYTTE